MKKFTPWLAGLLFLILSPIVVDANTTKRTGQTVSMTTDEIVEGNFYAVGNSVAITGTVEGDAIIFGGNTTVTGQVEEDLLLASLTAAINGSTTDDVRIIAGAVTITGEIGGNLSIVANQVKILSTATVAGDVMIYASEAIIEGKINGYLYGNTKTLRLDGEILSGVDVTSQNIQLGDRTVIAGNLTYSSGKDLLRANNAQVSGTIVRNSAPPVKNFVSWRVIIIQFLILLFTTLVFYLIARSRLEQFIMYPMFNQHYFLRALVLGFIFIFTPVAVAILLTSVLGFIVGVILLLVYLLLLFVTIPLMPIVVVKAMMKITSYKQLNLLHIITASAIIVTVAYMPIFGLFFVASLYVFTFGILLLLASDIRN